MVLLYENATDDVSVWGVWAFSMAYNRIRMSDSFDVMLFERTCIGRRNGPSVGQIFIVPSCAAGGG